MSTNPNHLLLKDAIFMTLVGNDSPSTSKRMLSASLPYVSENECKWYVQQDEKTLLFRDYSDREVRWVKTAKESLASAVRSLPRNAQSKGKRIDEIKFKIYSNETD